MMKATTRPNCEAIFGDEMGKRWQAVGTMIGQSIGHRQSATRLGISVDGTGRRKPQTALIEAEITSSTNGLAILAEVMINTRAL